jgi:hypothetical protein
VNVVLAVDAAKVVVNFPTEVKFWTTVPYVELVAVVKSAFINYGKLVEEDIRISRGCICLLQGEAPLQEDT